MVVQALWRSGRTAIRGPGLAVLAFAAAGANALGIFLSAFVFVASSGPLVPRLRRSPLAGAVLDGVNAASLALMGVVAVQLAASVLVDVVTLALAVASGACLLGFRINSTSLVLGGALVRFVANA